MQKTGSRQLLLFIFKSGFSKVNYVNAQLYESTPINKEF